MKIEKTLNDGKLRLKPAGRIDTNTAPELAAVIELDGVTELTIDLADVDYVSSAGLRVFLATQQKMTAANGKLILAHPRQMVMEIFDIAGFSDFFTFEAI